MTHTNIEEYIVHFMEGETTRAEEEAIYRFFRTSEIPEHLKLYAPMFAWYEAGMPEEPLAVQPVARVPEAAKKPLWRRIPLEVWSMGVAAMLVVGIGLGALFTLDGGEGEDWSCYEGSYIVVNGKRITDVEKIMPILLKTQAEAEKMEQGFEERLAEIRRMEEDAEAKEAMFENY